MPARFVNKVAIVTGASSGIGQSIATLLAGEGCSVCINYLSHADEANAMVEKIKAAGGDSIAVQCDITKPDEVARMVDEAYDKLGGCDILVNNAGVEKHAPFLEASEADYDLVLGTNLKAAFFLTQRVCKRLAEQKKPGRIINISSVHEDMVFPNFASYCAAKGGMRMLMRDLAVELGPLGITVNNVAPGAINTPINANLLADKPKLDALLNNIPLGRLGKPEEVAAVVAFLASDDGAYITGSTYFIDGGLMRNYKEQ